MKINLLGHCLLCLDKTDNEKVVSSSSSVSRMTFSNKLLPQLLLKKSAEKGNCIRDLFNQLHICNSGGGDVGKGGKEDEAPSSSHLPLCYSCLDQLKDLLKLLEELELKSEKLRSRISRGGDGRAFESLLRGSEVVEEKTKKATLGFLACLREECCDTTAIIPSEAIEEDGHDDQNDHVQYSNGGTGIDEEYQVLIVKDEEKNDFQEDDVVEVRGHPSKNFQDQQDSSNGGHGHPQILKIKMRGAGAGVRAPESDPSKMFSCPELNCTRRYTEHRYLVRHRREVHAYTPAAGPSKLFSCEYCQKGYNSKYSLKNHIESQHLRTNYICNICGKGFAGSNYLKLHHLRHLGYKPFHCPNKERGCEKSYTDRSNLKSHLKRCQLFLIEK